MIRIKRNELIKQAHKAKRTRSAQTGTLVGVRLQPQLLAGIDRYRDGEGQSRPEAIRLLLAIALG